MKVCRGLSRLQFARELLELWGEPVQVVVKDIFMLVLLYEEQEKGAFAVITVLSCLPGERFSFGKNEHVLTINLARDD